MAKILVIDDEALILNVLKAVLSSDGHEPVSVLSVQAALDLLEKSQFDLVISDLRMSPMDGIELLKRMRTKHMTVPVIMMTGYGTVKSAVEALQLDVFDYVSKPFKVDALLSTVRQALLYGQAVATEQTASTEDLSSATRLGSLIAASESMKNVCAMIQKVAPVDVPVVISGEYGVGKETIARTIHDNSNRKANKFLSVSCGEIPEPLFDMLLFGESGADAVPVSGPRPMWEDAQGGTMFFNDSDLIPPLVQERLREAIQSAPSSSTNQKGPVGVRLIGALINNPDQASSDVSEADALFRHLGAVEIHVTPLRARREDIVPLALLILQMKTAQGQQAPSLSSDARDALIQYNWPGNVSELDNTLEYGMAHMLAGKITRQSLPERVQSQTADVEAAKVKRDQMFGKNRSLKAFLSKPLQELKTRGAQA